MNLRIEPEIFEQYPDIILGVAVIRGINNRGNSSEIASLLREAEGSALGNLGSTPVVEHPLVVPWREAYRKFGAKPKECPSSIENLVRRISKGEEVRHINKLVDIYNIVSLKYFVPVGGEDVDKIEGDVLLTIAKEDEEPVILLGEKEARPPYPKEVIYRDDKGAICRRWNWKEVDRTKLTEATKNSCIVIEGLPPVDRGKIERAVDDLSGLIKKYCGGDVTTTVLDKRNPQVKLS